MHAAGAIAVLLLAAIAYTLGYAPSARAHDRASTEQASIDLARAESIATTEQVERARASLINMQAELGQAMRRAVDPEQAIRDSAADAGIEIRTLTEGQKIGVDELERTTMALDATGTFSDISGWLAGVSNAMPGLVVRGFVIASPEEGREVLSFQASLSVYAPQPISSGDGSTAEGPRAQPLVSPVR